MEKRWLSMKSYVYTKPINISKMEQTLEQIQELMKVCGHGTYKIHYWVVLFYTLLAAIVFQYGFIICPFLWLKIKRIIAARRPKKVA